MRFSELGNSRHVLLLPRPRRVRKGRLQVNSLVLRLTAEESVITTDYILYTLAYTYNNA